MTAIAALIGILLIRVAIPFRLMVAPLAIGIVLVWYALRRVDGGRQPQSDAVA